MVDIVGLIYHKLNLLHKINCFVKISFRIKTADGHLEVLPPDLTLRKTKLIQLATLSKGGGVAIGNPDSVNSIPITSIDTFQLYGTSAISGIIATPSQRAWILTLQSNGIL